MSIKLTNPFEQWGETGREPVTNDSVDNYSGGDNVHAQHLDYLWDNQYKQVDEFIQAIRTRLEDTRGDIILDGLVASTTANAREVKVSSSSNGAYINGKWTGSVTSDTVTLSTNGSGSLRTDSIWVDENGQIGKSEGTTTVSDTRHKVAEADVTTSDSIQELRNTGHDLTIHFASETAPDSGNEGDLWYDKTNDILKSYDGTSWSSTSASVSDNGSQVLSDPTDINYSDNLSVTDDGDGTVTVDATDTYPSASDSTTQVVASSSDFNFGSNLSVTDDGDGTVTIDASATSASVDIQDDGSEVVADASDINFKGGDFTVSDDGNGVAGVTIDQGSGSGLNADTLDGNHASAFASSGHNHDSSYVNESGDAMTGNLDMNQNRITELALESRTSDPSSPVEFQIWGRSDL